MHLKRLLTTPLQQQLSKGSLALLFVVTALGFVDATYLTVEHYMSSIPPCAIGGCETVLTSTYSSFAGIPVSLFGALFYFAILVLLMIYRDTKSAAAINVAATLTMLGAIVSIILIGLMVFVIHAICIYCLTSDILTIILCICFWFILKKSRAQIV